MLAGDLSARFREMNSVVGPLLLTAAASIAFAVAAFARDGLAAAALRGLTWVVLGIAVWTFIWTYGCRQWYSWTTA